MIKLRYISSWGGEILNKKALRVINIILVLVFILSGYIAYAEAGEDAYVIPIKGNITKATYQFVEAKVEEISDLNPKAIIFEIDTYGGLIVEAEKIWRVISDIEVPTIAFVNTKAESAGTLITVACDNIVMSDGATIGSAEVVPYSEKALSMWVSWLKEAAINNGRDPVLVAAMADKDIVIPGVVEQGKLLNLNTNESKELGFADLYTDDYETILNSFNIDYDEIKELEPTLRVKVAGFLSDPYVGIILLVIGFIGLVFELFAPGFGVGGTLSLIAFTLFFGGNILAGNSGFGVVLIFTLGIVLIIIEAVVPGFGLPGIGGIVAIITSIILAMNSIQGALISLSIAIILTIVAASLLIRFGYRSPYLNRIVLKTNQDKEEGYISMSYKDKYIDKEGIVVSYLRPSGTVEIDNERVDAVSESEFIEKGAKIKVVKVEGMKVIVKRIK